MEGGKDRPGNNHYLYNLLKRYDTGWINRSDWTNVHMGSNTGLNVDSNVAHNLDGNLSELIVKVLVSTDGTDNNSFEANAIIYAETSGLLFGVRISQVDSNNIQIQTGANGLYSLLDNGNGLIIAAQNWYYKIVVWKISCKEY